MSTNGRLALKVVWMKMKEHHVSGTTCVWCQYTPLANTLDFVFERNRKEGGREGERRERMCLDPLSTQKYLAPSLLIKVLGFCIIITIVLIIVACRVLYRISQGKF